MSFTGRKLLAAEDYCNAWDNGEEPDYAKALEDMNAWNISLGVFLWIAAMVALVPQHAKLWTVRSSAGLSFIMLFLGNINQISSVLNAILLKWPQLKACAPDEAGFWECAPSLLTIFQLGGAWIVTFPIYLEFMLFYWNTPEFTEDPRRAKRDWYICVALLIVFIIYSIIMYSIGLGLVFGLGECSSAVVNFGFSAGILSTVCTFIQWGPQIFSTYRLKAVGSYSILTLAIQAPGTLVVVYFLLFVSKEGISTWLAYLTAGIQQLILLSLLIYYNYKGKKEEEDSIHVNQSLPASGVSDMSEVEGGHKEKTRLLNFGKLT
eukprot:TRINITY_DN5806_c0_g1_i2.p1 TRINITY_DN5806_c0_g1~~TRINITY_DN5806_c0_g1_i2.p1  ORF type:complete len:320 (+),score=67.49 TRINITY_DN5806_c0_g1_i2:128-1087(+)